MQLPSFELTAPRWGKVRRSHRRHLPLLANSLDPSLLARSETDVTSLDPVQEGPGSGLPGGLKIRERHFSRALEITIAALGGLAVIGGVTLEGVHGRCLNKDLQCTSRIDSQKLGRASWLVGTQLLVSSLVFLIIDEWPRRRRPKAQRRAFITKSR